MITIPKGKGAAHAARCYRSHCRLPGSAHRGAGPRSAATWSRTRRSGRCSEPAHARTNGWTTSLTESPSRPARSGCTSRPFSPADVADRLGHLLEQDPQLASRPSNRAIDGQTKRRTSSAPGEETACNISSSLTSVRLPRKAAGVDAALAGTACPELVEGACPELVEGACPELVEGACPELVEGPGSHSPPRRRHCVQNSSKFSRNKAASPNSRHRCWSHCLKSCAGCSPGSPAAGLPRGKAR